MKQKLDIEKTKELETIAKELDAEKLRLSAVIDSFDSLTDEQRLEIMDRYDKNVGCKIENCR